MIHFHIQRFKVIDFMVIELGFFRKKKMNEKIDQMWKAILGKHVLHNRSTNFCILVIFHTFFTFISLKVKLKVKMKNILLYGFQWDRPYQYLYTQYYCTV